MNNKVNEANNLIFGKNAVKEALCAHRVLKVFISNAFRDNRISALISEQCIPQFVRANSELTGLANGGVHQGIVAIIKPYEYTPLEKVLEEAKKVTNPILVILDGITDPHNLGAIIRCCDIFGVSGVIISKHEQASLSPIVAKTSAGAINYVPVAQVGNLNQTIAKLKEAGYWIVAADGAGKISYLDLKYDFPTALVIGSEGFGISSLILKNSDYIVKIPMYGKVNSLNASVAAGVLLARIKG